MNSLNKIDIIRCVFYQMIEGNHHVRDLLYNVIGDNYLVIKLTGYKGSAKNYDSYNDKYDICCGLQEIPLLYNRSKELSIHRSEESKIVVDKRYSDMLCQEEVCRKIIIEKENGFYTDVAKMIEESDFVTGENPTYIDSLAMYAILYSLYHEIGHVIYDKSLDNQIEREIKADNFAFEAIIQLDGCCKNDDNNKLLGTFIGVTNTLFVCDVKEEYDDKDHPPTFERIVSLLNHWEISSESNYWILASDLVRKWANNSHIGFEDNMAHNLSPKNMYEQLCNQIKIEICNTYNQIPPCRVENTE